VSIAAVKRQPELQRESGVSADGEKSCRVDKTADEVDRRANFITPSSALQSSSRRHQNRLFGPDAPRNAVVAHVASRKLSEQHTRTGTVEMRCDGRNVGIRRRCVFTSRRRQMGCIDTEHPFRIGGRIGVSADSTRVRLRRVDRTQATHLRQNTGTWVSVYVTSGQERRKTSHSDWNGGDPGCDGNSGCVDVA